MSTLATPQWVINIRKIQDQLSEREKNVADFMCTNMAEVLDLSIGDIAKRSGTSKSTVVRFCNHLGYSGLKEFKVKFHGNTTLPEIENTQVKWSDTTEEVKSKIFAGSINSLRDSFNTLDIVAIESATDALMKAKNIDIYGQGGSTPIAMYLRHQLMKIGVRSSLYSDAQSQHLSLSQFRSGDVAIAISCSGESPEILAAMRWAKEIGLLVITITNFPDSSLGKISDYCLCNTAGSFFYEDKNSYARIAQLATVNVLYLVLAVKMGKSTVDEVQTRNKRARSFSK